MRTAVHHDAISNYREATAKMNGPTATFICALCKGFHEIAGRKKHAMIGRRTLWKCKVCVDGRK